MCDVSDENCIGYLQGTNGIKANEDSSNLFNKFTNVISINGLDNIDTSNVTNMSGMFASMTNLQDINLSTWDTSKVIKIDSFITSSNYLKKVNLQNFDLSKVESHDTWLLLTTPDTTLDMSNSILPKNCSYLFSNGPGFRGNAIILDNVDTSHVTDMSYMFNGTSNLQELDVSSFDTSNVTDMNMMFGNMPNIQELDLSSFDTSKVTNMKGMFTCTYKLQSITFGPKFVHKAEATTSRMFSNCLSQDRPTGESWQDVSFD